MKSIAILTGGTSSEREVALWSSETVKEVLEKDYEVVVFDFPRDMDRFVASRDRFGVAVPVFHGPMGEDGTIQGFLKTLQVPFLFSDVEAHAVGMNKRLGKLVAKDAGLNVIDGYRLSKGDDASFEFECVIKPLAGGSTIGISIATSREEFEKGVVEAFGYSDEVLVEKLIRGREFTVAVIEEQDEAIALPVTEIESDDGFFDFDQKYTDGKMAQEVCPAEIGNDLRRTLQDHAVKIHGAIGARHVSRSDFIVDDAGTPWFLEINTIPGLTKNSLVPKAILASGRTLRQAFGDWIASVTSRA